MNTEFTVSSKSAELTVKLIKDYLATGLVPNEECGPLIEIEQALAWGDRVVIERVPKE